MFSDKEFEVRNIISERLERGKVSLVIEYQRPAEQEIKHTYNQSLFIAYFSELKKLANRVLAPYEGLFELALNSPDVIQTNVKEGSNEEEWKRVKASIENAIGKCEEFRKEEGKVLGKMLLDCCEVIRGRA